VPSADGSGLVALVGGRLRASGQTQPLDDVWQLSWAHGGRDEVCRDAGDHDGDGLAGCADPDCWYRCAPLCSPGLACPASAPSCGDGRCDQTFETCALCPGDCGACPPVCGDGVCSAAEQCPGDCP
jgi:hypothetical protein